MAKYIDAEEVIKTIKTGYYPASEEDYELETDYMWSIGFNAGLDRAMHDIACAPAADVEPVAHAHWIKRDGYTECSHCEYRYDSPECEDESDRTTRCPNCGAHMVEGV